MAHFNDTVDIQLKPLQETFVDEPSSLEEVNIDELVFDLEHNLKDINKLHVFHAISVFTSCLKDIIKLQADKTLFKKFKTQQLEKHHVNIDTELNGNLKGYSKILKISTPPDRSDTPPASPPLKFARLQDNFSEISLEFVRDRTPDSLFNEGEIDSARLMEFAKTDSSDELPSDPPYIPIEELIKNMPSEPASEPITSPNPKRLREEIEYNQALRISAQNVHLLKSFNLVKLPALSIEQFLVRIKTYSSSTSVLVYIHSAYLMFKLCILLDIIPLTDYNVHRFILTLIRCLTKNLEDLYQKQKPFATVGGVSKADLFRIEMGFLYLSNFKLVTGEEILNNYLKEEFIELRKFCKEHLDDNSGSLNEY